MTSRVRPAFFASGGLKTGTPLLIASMPVSAVQPVAKACSTRNSGQRLRRPAAPTVASGITSSGAAAGTRRRPASAGR